MDRYSDADELWTMAFLRACVSGGFQESRDGEVVGETIGYGMKLEDLQRTVVHCPVRGFSPQYACAEVLWMLAGCVDSEMILAYSPNYKRFLEPNGGTYGGYGIRWNSDPGYLTSSIRAMRALEGQTGIEWSKEGAEALLGHTLSSQCMAVMSLLSTHPNDRRAIITHWNGGDLLHAIARDKKDLPCCLSLQFLRRQDTIHSVAFCRSQDAWLGLPNDIFTFTCLNRLIADCLHCTPGTHSQLIGSLHAYERHANWHGSVEAWWAERQETRQPRLAHGWTAGDVSLASIGSAVDYALAAEKEARKNNGQLPEDLLNGVFGNEMLHDLVAVTATKWGADPYRIKSPALRSFFP